MGRVITFAGLPYREAATGVKRAPITGGDMKEMSAEVIRVARGAALTEDVPEGSDRYLFTLTGGADRKSTRLNSSHGYISYAVFCLKKKKNKRYRNYQITSRKRK